MKSPVFILQISAALSQEDIDSIREALDFSYTSGYEKGYNDGRFVSPIKNPSPPVSVPNNIPNIPFISSVQKRIW